MECIKNKFKEVITHSQNIQDPKVDILFKQWETNKKDFIKLMGGKLIYEHPEKITFHLSPEDRQEKLKSLFVNIIDYPDLANFISKNHEDFFTGILSKDYYYNDLKIQKGSKMVKSFKYFIGDKCILTDIQNLASRIIQEDKIEGTLCVSVHPLDYLSISENGMNWRSCHALDGDYRAGNLSYMADSSTIICYLKSDHDAVAPNFPFYWNNKKWRTLLFFSKDRNMIFAGRQYPFSAQSILDFALDTLLPESGILTNKFSNWKDNYITQFEGYALDKKYCFVGGVNLIGIEKLMEREPNKKTELFYNDLIYSSVYKRPLYSYRLDKYFSPLDGVYECGPRYSIDWEKTKFQIGEDVKCLHCEKDIITEGDTMICDCCSEEVEPMQICSICGRNIYDIGTAYLDTDGDNLWICEDCASEYLRECDSCGTWYHIDRMIEDDMTGAMICDNCFRDLKGR